MSCKQALKCGLSQPKSLGESGVLSTIAATTKIVRNVCGSLCYTRQFSCNLRCNIVLSQPTSTNYEKTALVFRLRIKCDITLFSNSFKTPPLSGSRDKREV